VCRNWGLDSTARVERACIRTDSCQVTDTTAPASTARADAGELNPSGELVLLTLAEAAALLRVSRQALHRWRRRGDGPPVITLPGGTVRIARSDLEEWLRARQVTDHAREESL
jgi:excisionase family DNA binding protein